MGYYVLRVIVIQMVLLCYVSPYNFVLYLLLYKDVKYNNIIILFQVHTEIPQIIQNDG